MPNTTKRPAGKNHPADIQTANNRVKKYISIISAILLLCAVIGCNGPVKKSADGYNNTDQTSDFSNGVSCTLTHQDLPVPANLTASKEGTGEYSGIKLTWNSTGSAWYHVYWGTTNDKAAAKKLDSVDSNSKKVYADIHKLVSGTTYYFWVKSADGNKTDDNTSAFSSVASYTWTE